MKSRLGLIGPLPPPAGGMARQTFQLSQLLQQEGVDVQLLQTNAPYKPACVERLKGVRAVFRLLAYVASVWRLCGRVDVIHLMANSGWSWQLFAAPVLWIAHFRGIPVVVNYRGGEADSYFQQSFKRVRPSLNKASKVVVPSNFLKDVFARYGVATEVIPNIINVERFSPSDTLNGDGQYHIVIARNLEAIYGIDTAIKAMEKIHRQLPDARLAIAGSGPLLNHLKALVESLGLNAVVDFVGRLEPDTMAQLYRSADLMINPSTVDNMPNSILEALACGVPVLTTSVGGIPYMVEQGKTAVLVPPGDDKVMADEAIRLLRDCQARQTLSNAGLREVQQYSWPSVKEQWLSCYKLLGTSA